MKGLNPKNESEENRRTLRSPRNLRRLSVSLNHVAFLGDPYPGGRK